MPSSAVADAILAISRRPLVEEAAAAALADLDALMWRRDVRRKADEYALASIERGARSSAVIEGADVVEPDDSPMGKVLGSAIAVTAEVPGQVSVWSTAPLQALAHLHAVAARPFSDEEHLGRPRATDEADDPLRIGVAVAPELLAPRLAALAEVARVDAPAVVIAAMVHAELMTMRPFAWGSGLVARASVRLVLADRAVDPSNFCIPEHGMLEQGRPAYVKAMRDYASGTPDGIDAMVRWFATSIGLGVQAV